MPTSEPPAGRELEAMLPEVYDQLRGAAARYLRRQPAGFTLNPTELVHEACIQLMAHGLAEWTSTGHFRAIATRKIWQVVVDHVKQRAALKRGGGGIKQPNAGSHAPTVERPNWKRTPLEQVTVEWRERPLDVLDLADALAELNQESGRLHDVVMLHWFGGMTFAEVGEQLEIGRSTAEKDFRYALAWLNRRLAGKAGDGH